MTLISWHEYLLYDLTNIVRDTRAAKLDT